jgi:DNA invertase Pin-like site-specific DNA recombinase
MKQVALYLRVSTSGQTVTNQRQDLEAAAARHGWASNAPQPIRLAGSPLLKDVRT